MTKRTLSLKIGNVVIGKRERAGDQNLSSLRYMLKKIQEIRLPQTLAKVDLVIYDDKRFSFERNCVLLALRQFFVRVNQWIHSDEGLTLETSVFEYFTVAN